MGAPGSGLKSFLSLGMESVYGTGVTITDKTEIVRGGLDADPVYVSDPSLYDQPSQRGEYFLAVRYPGSFTLRANYAGKALLKLLKAMMGDVTTTLVEAATSWDHVFKEAATLPSLSAEHSEGDIPTGKVSDITGMKVTGATIDIRAGSGNAGMVTIGLDVLAKTKTVNQTPTALSFPAVKPVLFSQAITMDDGTADASSDIKVRSVSMRLTNPVLEGDDALFVGSSSIDEPVRNGFLSVEWTIEQQFRTMSQFTNAQTGANASPKVILRGDALGANFYELELRSGTCSVPRWSAPVEGPNIVIARSTMRASNDATDASALVIRVRNAESAV